MRTYQYQYSHLCRSAILERLLGVLHTSPPGAAKPGGAHSQSKSGSAAQSRAPSVAVLSQLHSLLSAHDDVRLRHLAFMALMRLGGLAPTLFREEEEFAAAGEPSSHPCESTLHSALKFRFHICLLYLCLSSVEVPDVIDVLKGRVCKE